ncbi:MAG: hypothetical protein ACI4PH_01600 [Faecousia sp.]
MVTAGNAFGAIRFSFAQADLTEMRKKFMTLRGTDCHVAALLAMTMVDGTLAHGIDNDTMLIKADNHNDRLSSLWQKILKQLCVGGGILDAPYGEMLNDQKTYCMRKGRQGCRPLRTVA